MARMAQGRMHGELAEADRLMRSTRTSDHAAGAALLAAIAAEPARAGCADKAAAADNAVASAAAARLGDAFMNGSAVVRYIATRTVVEIASAGLSHVNHEGDGAGGRSNADVATMIAASAILSTDDLNDAALLPAQHGGAGRAAAWQRLSKPLTLIAKVKRVLYSNDASARVMAFVMLGGMAEIIASPSETRAAGAEPDAMADHLEILHAMWLAIEGSNSMLELRAASQALQMVCSISAECSAATLQRVLGRLRLIKTDTATFVCLADLMQNMHHTTALANKAQLGCEQLLLSSGARDEFTILTTAAVCRLLEVLTALALKAPSNTDRQVQLLLRMIRSDGRSAVRVTAIHCLRRLAKSCAVTSSTSASLVVAIVHLAGRMRAATPVGGARDEQQRRDTVAATWMEVDSDAHGAGADEHNRNGNGRRSCCLTTERLATARLIHTMIRYHGRTIVSSLDAHSNDEMGLAALLLCLKEAMLPYTTGFGELQLRFTCAVALLRLVVMMEDEHLGISLLRDGIEGGGHPCAVDPIGALTACLETLVLVQSLPTVPPTLRVLCASLVTVVVEVAHVHKRLGDEFCELVAFTLREFIKTKFTSASLPGKRDRTGTHARGSDGATSSDGIGIVGVDGASHTQASRSSGNDQAIFIVKVLLSCYHGLTFESVRSPTTREGAMDDGHGDMETEASGRGGRGDRGWATLLLLPIERCISECINARKVQEKNATGQTPDVGVECLDAAKGRGDSRRAGNDRMLTLLANFYINAYTRLERFGFSMGGADWSEQAANERRRYRQANSYVIQIVRAMTEPTAAEDTDVTGGDAGALFVRTENIFPVYTLGASCLRRCLHQSAYTLLSITRMYVVSEWNTAWLQALLLVAKAGISMDCDGGVVARVEIDASDGVTLAYREENDHETPRFPENNVAFQLLESSDSLREASKLMMRAHGCSPAHHRSASMRSLARLMEYRCEQQRQLSSLLSGIHFLLPAEAPTQSSGRGVLMYDRNSLSLVREFTSLGRECMRVFDAFDRLRADVMAAAPSRPGGSGGGNDFSTDDAGSAKRSHKSRAAKKQEGAEDVTHLGDYCVISAVAGCIAINVAACLTRTHGSEIREDQGSGVDDDMSQLSTRLRKSLSVKVEAMTDIGGHEVEGSLLSLAHAVMTMPAIATNENLYLGRLYDFASKAGMYRCHIPARML